MPFPTVEETESSDMEVEAVPEVGAEEVEVETETGQASEEPIEVKVKSAIPPLRPLTIAPKPTKIPLTIKQPITGQQLLLLPGTTAGQSFKLVNPQGGALSLANLALGKPIQIRTATKTTTTNNISVLQPKQVIMRKVTAPAQKTIVAGETKQTSIVLTSPKIESKPSQENLILSPTKTITLAQAQELGLLSCSKLMQTKPTTMIVNKSPTKTLKLVAQGKPHTKILPAPLNVSKSTQPQRIILKPASSSSLNAGQIVHVTDTQQMQPGQLHQISIPGKGIQYIKIVSLASTTSPETTTNTVTLASPKMATQVVNIGNNKLPVLSTIATTKAANVVLNESIGATATAKTFKTNAVRPALQVPAANQLLMVPTSYLSQQSVTPKVAIAPSKAKSASPEEITVEPNVMRPRKPCNCNKSQCLKLYCDCFANGEFCHMCNCANCLNNLESEEHRQRAIKSCLERNPYAFRPKIGKSRDNMGDTTIRKHTKGCNCKRSGCLKNYCECYEAKIACSNNCKCVGCRNVEDALDKKENILKQIAIAPVPVGSPLAVKLNPYRNSMPFRQRRHSNSKHASNFITEDVIEATCQCLLAISDTGETNAQDDELTKLQIIEEFGRCLTEIINCSYNKNVSVNAN